MINDSYDGNRWLKARKLLYFWVLLSQVIGLTAIGLLIFYCIHYGGGFGWQSSPNKEFNWHPLLMSLGLIFLYGDATLVYRVFPDTKKITVKIIHAVLLALSLICASIGLKAVFDSHNLANPPAVNLYSIHSWFGLTTVILFGLQWVCGFVFFLFPKLSDEYRRFYLPSHKFWGRSILILATITAVSGVDENASFAQLYSAGANLTQRNIMNVYGLLLVAFVFMIQYILLTPEYERPLDDSAERIPLTAMPAATYHNDAIR